MRHLTAIFTIAMVPFVIIVIGYDLDGYPRWEVVQAQLLGVIAVMSVRIALRVHDL